MFHIEDDQVGISKERIEELMNDFGVEEEDIKTLRRLTQKYDFVPEFMVDSLVEEMCSIIRVDTAFGKEYKRYNLMDIADVVDMVVFRHYEDVMRLSESTDDEDLSDNSELSIRDENDLDYDDEEEDYDNDHGIIIL